MPSFRARLINTLLRLTIKRQWRPGLQIEEIRSHAARSDQRLARHVRPIETEAVTLAGVPAQWYGEASLAARAGTLLYLHGGAWCLHLPALYAAWATQLARRTGLRVLLVDYRLAPEHPFPAGVEDCYGVYRALLNAGVLPDVVAGDSAGGSLTLTTLQRARDAGLPLPRCAVLLSPSTDLTLSGASARYNAAADPMFSDKAGDLLPEIYCPGQARNQPLLSPLFGSWAGLPPLYFLAGSTEMLLDDSIRAQDRAIQAGVDARLDVWPQMPHVFPLFTFLPEARDALERITKFIAEHAGRGARGALAAATSSGFVATHANVTTASAEAVVRRSL
jgi:acetyl esterase/lipase